MTRTGTVWLCACAAVAAMATVHGADLVLRGAKIYTSPSAPPIGDGIVVVRGSKISAVGRAGSVTVPPRARILDCTGMVIAAGFQNSHDHFTESRWDHAAAQPAARLTEQFTSMFAMYGFTTVVDAAAIFENSSRLRARVESGEVLGPRMILPVATLFPPHGLPVYADDFQKTHDWVPDEPANAAAAVQAVRRNRGEPEDIVKLFTGSLVTYQDIRPMPLEVARAAVAEAHRQGRLVWAHPSNLEGVKIALEAGADVLAHTTSVPGAWTPDLIHDLVSHKMSLIPTLKLWKYVMENAPDPRVGDQMIGNAVVQLRDFARAGGQVLFGTDVGFMHDYDPTDEYVYMARALSPMQILASLTTAPAERFHESGRRGRVAAGMDADLVVLGSDPAQNPRAFADVRYTIRAGNIVYPIKPVD